MPAEAAGMAATDHRGEQSNFTEGGEGNTGQGLGYKAPGACLGLHPEVLDWLFTA